MGREDTRGPTEDEFARSTWVEFIRALKGRPEYLLVLAFLFVISLVSLSQGGPWLFVVFLSVVLLAAFAIYLVYRAGHAQSQRSAAVQAQRHSEAQATEALEAQRVSEAKLKELSDLGRKREAVKGIFENLLDNEADSYFIYSSHPTNDLLDQDWQPIVSPHPKDERVTAFPDAQGIAKIHGLLFLADKTRRLHSITSDQFQQSHWENHLILVGSRRANAVTEKALAKFGSPFEFSKSGEWRIIERDSSESSWPRDSELATLDYGILAKMKRRIPAGERIYVAVAGLGAFGTLGCCHYLEAHAEELFGEFQSDPFACLISVDRDIGFSSARLVKPVRL